MDKKCDNCGREYEEVEEETTFDDGEGDTITCECGYKVKSRVPFSGRGIRIRLVPKKKIKPISASQA